MPVFRQKDVSRGCASDVAQISKLSVGLHLTYCSRKPGTQRVPLKVRAAVSHPDLNVLQWLVACVQTKIRWLDKIFSGLRSHFFIFQLVGRRVLYTLLN